MKIAVILASLMLLFGSIAIISVDDCDAARLGGGKSFGSKPFMNKSAPPPAMRQQNRQQNMQPGAAAARQGGMFGGMGGLFGGLLAGTLLGSLLGGHGFGGGGGILDLILLALLVFVGWKLFSRFRQRQSQEPAAAGMGSGLGSLFGGNGNTAGQPLQRNDVSVQPGGWGALGGSQSNFSAPVVNVPADFNVDEFLKGAKAAYTRLQRSWDKRDLSDISRFATPAVMRELEAQAKADPTPSNTEIMLINAQLEGFETEGDEEQATVYFNVLLRENPNQQAPEDVRELWHFARQGKNGEWKLDGLQQVE